MRLDCVRPNFRIYIFFSKLTLYSSGFPVPVERIYEIFSVLATWLSSIIDLLLR
jgi:hypothetical protein